MSFVTNIAKIFIRSYQLALSPLLGCNCRFVPSCSHYALAAIETHGIYKGGFLTVKRLLRCHPFTEAGYDPVPIVFPIYTRTSSDVVSCSKTYTSPSFSSTEIKRKHYINPNSNN